MLLVAWGRLRAVHRALRAWVAVARAGRAARERSRHAEDGPGVFRGALCTQELCPGLPRTLSEGLTHARKDALSLS